MSSTTAIPLFSSVLADVYEAASSLSPGAFEEMLFSSLRKLIGFDKAVIRFAGKTLAVEPTRKVAPHGRTAVRRKPVARGLNRVIGGRIGQGVRSACKHVCVNDADKRVVLHLADDQLAHSVAASATSRNWMLLYRQPDAVTPTEASELMVSLWPHLINALHINQQHELDAYDDSHEKRARALLDRSGSIALADQAFVKLLEREWPRMTPSLLPPLIWAKLLCEQTYRGRHITLDMYDGSGRESVVCEARPTSPLDRLGEAERVVAQLLKDGLCHKEIALKMGTSPNTVRTQIARLYKKLQVHSKSSLVKALAEC